MSILLSNNKYLSSKEAGALGGYTHDYVSKLCRESSVTCKRIGRSWFVEEDSLRAFIIAQEHHKALLKDQLKEMRKNEYNRHLGDLQEKETAPEVAVPVLDIPTLQVTRTAREHVPHNALFAAPQYNTMLANRALQKIQHTHANVAVQSRYVPVVVAFSEKALALALACAIVFSGYALTDASVLTRAGNAAQTAIASIFAASNSMPAIVAQGGRAFDVLTYRSDSIARAAFTQPAFAFVGAQETVGRFGIAVAQGASSFFDMFAHFSSPSSLFVVDGSALGRVEVAVREAPRVGAGVQRTESTIAKGTQSIQQKPIVTSALPTTVITNPVVERIIERIVPQPVAQQTLTPFEIQTKLDVLENELRKEIFSMSAANDTRPVDNFRMIALSQRIDQLNGTDISNAAITSSSVGATSLTVSGGATFNGNATFNGTLTTTGTISTTNLTLSGDLTVGGDDLFMGTNTSGFVLVADGTNYNPVDVSGDIDIDSTGATTIGANAVALGTDTTGNYVATIADSGASTITVNNSGTENAAVTLGITADSIGDTQLAFNTGQHLTTTSSPTFAGITLNGFSGFLKATAGVIATALIDLTSDVTGILPDANVSDTLTIGASSTVADGALSGNVSLLGQTIESSEITDGTITGTDIAAATIANSNLANSAVTVTAGTGLANGGPVSLGDSTTLNLDLNELTTSTTNSDGAYFAVVDSLGNQNKLTKANINLSGFNNDANFITSSGAPVQSVFGRTGTVTAQSGDYTTTQVTEGTNLYYTDARARNALSSSATGLTYTAGTGDFALTTGYVIPTTTEETNWNTAYGWGNHASAGYLVAANNLSDLTNTTTARTNLGLGALATLSAVSGGTGGTITDGTITAADLSATAGILGTQIANGTIANANLANSTIALSTGTTGTDVNVSGSPASLGGTLTLNIPTASATNRGVLSSTDWSTFNAKQAAGNYITALTGDITASGPGSAAAILATVNTNVGSFGSSTAIPTFTVNAKGLITAASTNAVIAPAGTLTGAALAANVLSSSLTSVGTITSGTWQGTAIGDAYLTKTGDWTGTLDGYEGATLNQNISNTDLTLTGNRTLTLGANTLNIAGSTTGDFSVNTDQLFVDTSAGNVGIGTTSPLYQLSVQATAPSVNMFQMVGTGATDNVLFGMQNATRQWTLGINGTSDFFRITDNTAGVARLTITNTGNVGIGTTGPAGELHVKAVSGDTNIIAGDTDSGTGKFYLNLWSDTSNGVGRLDTYSTTDGWKNLVLNAGGGNVGIGTSAPLDGLDAAAGFGITTPINQYMGSNIYFNSGWKYRANGVGGVMKLANSGIGGITFDVAPTNASGAGAAATLTTAMTILPSGNVGIGNTTPKSKLSVTGTSGGFVGDGQSSIFQITTGTGAQTDNKLEFGVLDANYAYIQNSKPGTATYALSLNPNGGNVGIGTTTSPGNLLTVGNVASLTTVTTVNTSGVIESNGYRGRAGTGGAISNVMNTNWSGSCAQQWVDITNIGSYICASDQRLKTNIVSLADTNGLAVIDALNPVTFNWKNAESGTTTQYGFIAQEVQGVLPDLVINTGLVSADTPDGMLRLDYNGLIAPIVKAIQELWARVQDYFARTEQLERQVADLQARVAQLESQQSGSQSAAVYSTTNTNTQPPTIHINGNNPATIAVGDTYNDLGATAKTPDGNDLTVTLLVNDEGVSTVQLDTSTDATYTITYQATYNGQVVEATRTVIVGSGGNSDTISIQPEEPVPEQSSDVLNETF